MLAYQSAWLRRRYPAEFLAALLNAQPMGFYPPASLVRDAQRRGRAGAAARASPAPRPICAIEDGAVRIGLGYVREVRRRRGRAPGGPSATRDGPFRDIADLAARADLRREQLAQLVRAGACDVFDRPRRAMLWELGVLARPRTGARRHPARPADPGRRRPRRCPSSAASSARSPTTRPPACPPAGTWWRWCARACRPGSCTAAELRETPHGTDVRRRRAGGRAPAARRPPAGIVFLLLEDETGMVNCIVRPRGLRAPPGAWCAPTRW